MGLHLPWSGTETPNNFYRTGLDSIGIGIGMRIIVRSRAANRDRIGGGSGFHRATVWLPATGSGYGSDRVRANRAAQLPAQT